MARILYGVQGEGRGHSSRSRIVIEHLLERGHEVRVFSSQKGYGYLREHLPEVTEIFGLAFEFDGEKVDLLRTVRRNLEQGSADLPDTLRRLVRAWTEFRPQIAITDFEPFVPYARTWLGIPFLSIDHQHVLTHYRPEYPYAWRTEYLQARTVVDAMYRGAERYYTTSFFFPEVRERYRGRAILVPPILRREVLERTPRHDGPILLYATTSEARQALDLMRGRREPCVAYGFRSAGPSSGLPDHSSEPAPCRVPAAAPPRQEPAGGDNIEFRPPSTEGFLDDLANASAVITNGGYTLMSEALYLGKPVYAIPIRNQFEQMLNGWYFERLGYGLFDLAPSRGRLERFLDGLDYFRANIERDRNQSDGMPAGRRDRREDDPRGPFRGGLRGVPDGPARDVLDDAPRGPFGDGLRDRLRDRFRGNEILFDALDRRMETL